jgi:hypothetical protein
MPPEADPKPKGEYALDPELQEYRSLMEPPKLFIDGFNWSSLVAAVFISLIMVPGALYMGLVSGTDTGAAGKWVTVILFLEVARRMHKKLGRAEIFVLFYMCGAAAVAPFGSLLFRQFIVQSDAVSAQGWQSEFPSWFAPTDPDVLAQRSFFSWHWLPALGMVMLTMVLHRVDGRILGYGLFKLTSDYEKLPFPLAPVGAMGVLALEEEADENSSRWRWFSIGGAIGLIFGFVYMGVPILSHAILGVSIQPLPIPFSDWTGRTENILPAVATGLSFDMGNLLIGMVMPWWAVVGAIIGVIITTIGNPILYNYGVLNQWRPGDGTVVTIYKNQIDFYFSFGMGLSIAVALIGLYAVVQSLRRAKTKQTLENEVYGPPPGRGDIPNWAIITTYFTYVIGYILLSGWLIDWHRGVILVMCFYGFVYTPIISYVTARLEGLCGQTVNLPLVSEVGFLLSGYKGLKVWFLPMPLSNYGDDTVLYRQAELTGTKFWSIWKADIFLVPIILISSIFFANFIWSMAPVPSSAYPYAQKMWELQAMNQTITWSATMDEFSPFYKAINAWYITAGLVLGSVAYAALAVLGAPILIIYGLVRGTGQSLPHVIIVQFIGAALGRYWFLRKYGPAWRHNIPIILAGFSCGAGLIGMFCVGVTFLSKAVFQSPY